jgi:AraC-like DNA-binding protein
MLRMTDDPILSICESVGFRSMTSFNRHFSATVGEAPSAWRKHSQSGDLPASQSLDSSFSTTSQEAAF